MERIKKKYVGFTVAIISLVAIICGLLIAFISTSTVASAYAMQLENVYQKSFSELVTNINNIEVDLSKILVSSGTKTRGDLYDSVYTNCNYASSNLSSLPVNYDAINSTATFINQMGGFSYYASQKLLEGNNLSETDINSTNELYNVCVYIQDVLNNFVKDINYDFSILSTNGQQGNSSLGLMFSTMQSENVEYPTLIYDGPFSESVTNKEILGLTGEEITKEKAEAIVRNAYEEHSIYNLRFEGETNAKFKTYNYSFMTDSGRSYYIQIAKKGGLILSITSYGGTDKGDLTLTDCKSKAEDFAKKIGLDVQSVWATTLNGTTYVNLTPVVGDIIIYPDMIKAKVSCTTGEILGWEASSYAYNHTERQNLTTKISMQNAKETVSPLLTIETERIALIPYKYSNELLTYEFKCSYNNTTYYVYIDANTGNESRVLKVISTTSGELLQ